MELFDKKFVHFMWDDELEGKKCFVSDYVDDLKGFVEHDRGDMCFEVVGKGTANYPFEVLHNDTHNSYQFAYYDPNYEVKKAFNEGKKIEFCHRDAHNYWMDATTPTWRVDCEYRVKEEERGKGKWIAYIQRNGDKCRLVFCAENRWQYVQDRFGAKTKLFVGMYAEVSTWCRARQKFAPLIKAWEDDKTIEFFNPIDGIWSAAIKPIWEPDLKYRVKPECPCDAGIDSKACVGCEHSEDGKPHPFENYHCYGCDKSSKTKYRPYINSAEMIVDFIDRFKVKCPSYCEPLIWMKHKRDANSGHLITDFFHGAGVRVCGGFFSFEALLYEYTYLDGSPCGMETE